MSYDVRVLCRPEVAAGFSLAGLRTVEADEGPVGTARLADELATPELGVLLVQQRLYDALPEDVRRRLGRRPLPMVVPFPDPAFVARPEAAEAYIIELLRQVVGYRVRLR